MVCKQSEEGIWAVSGGSQTLERPETLDRPLKDGRWMVVIFNNETNSLDEVIQVLIEATGCDLQEAYMETWEAHQYGSAPVHFASKTECTQAAQVIRAIGVKTEVSPEWLD